MKRERVYQGYGEEYNVKKGKGEAISSYLYWEEYQVGKKGRGTKHLGKKFKI